MSKTIYKMNTFFVTFVVLGCVALSSQTTCEFPNGGNGGVLDADDKYITGSVLTWCDVANNTRAYVDSTGLEHLDYWDNASRCFDVCMPSGNVPCADKMLRQANYSFCKIFPHIINNQPLADYFQKVCNEFLALINAGNFRDIDNYMIDAYIKFNQLTCN